MDKKIFRQGNIITRSLKFKLVDCTIYREGNIMHEKIKLPDNVEITRHYLELYSKEGDVVVEIGGSKLMQQKCTCTINDFVQLCVTKGIVETILE